MLKWLFSGRKRRETYAPLYKARAEEKAAAVSASLEDQARDFHSASPAGKMAAIATKPLNTAHDLALAYSPGVAAPCLDIAADPGAARVFTNKAGLVAIVSNGTAVLGLGDIGPLAAKPVMEGKAALFKRFAGLNAVDICVDEKDPKKLANIITALEPSFGGINLEDIKAPECFEVEALAREKMAIPVFHDDQHGTAVCVLAALNNALSLASKRLDEVKIVTSGAGAAAMACLDLLVGAGARRENVTVVDRAGVIYQGRKDGMNAQKQRYAVKTKARSLEDAVKGSDVFLGLSGPGLLSPQMVETMAPAPIIFALANPDPEIWPEDAKAVSEDVIVATGRTDYPNQVNNVLCFPFLFRGALDVGASQISDGMLLAAAGAIGALARTAPPDQLRDVYGADEIYVFGPDYILPKPFDTRLLPKVASAVAAAAMREALAADPIADLTAYEVALAREALVLAGLE